MIDGKKAVSVAKEFCKGACYRPIMTHGKAIAQLEPVLDDLVSVSYIKDSKGIQETLKALRKIGFDGMLCTIETETESNGFSVQNLICATII
mgnify:CR=1 FL=1